MRRLLIVLALVGSALVGAATPGASAPAVVRLEGADRYATAVEISKANAPAGVAVAYVAYVASGTAVADAVAATPVAGAGKAPILLVPRSSIPAVVVAELDRLDPGRIVVLGGEGAVDEDVVTQLQRHTDGTVTRLAGPDRYATAARISAGSFEPGVPMAYVVSGTSETDALAAVASLGEFAPPTADLFLASGRSTADALAGAWAAGAADFPVLLTEPACVPGRVLAEIDRLQPQRLLLLGGDAVLAGAVGGLAPCEVAVTTIATGLNVPWDVAFVPGGRAYVTERRTGRVLLRETDGAVREVHRLPSADLGEGGLLGLEASPDFATDGLLYAFFTGADDNRLVRFRPGGPVEVLLSGIPRAANHDAGRIAFGPEGKLYVATGDAGVPSRSQDDGLAGKILRLDPDGSVPADNPTRARASTPRASATPRAWPGTPRAGSTPRSSGPTATTRSTSCGPTATTAGRW